MKNYILIAGINRAGKSTLFQSEHDWFADTRANRINADEELVRLGGDSNSVLDQAAGARIAVKKMREFMIAGLSFHQETTLSGKTDVARILKAKKLGYRVSLLYVALDTPELAKQRVAMRVKRGGHNIPDADIERRYSRSLDNLAVIARLVDKVHVFDNSAGSVTEIYWRRSNNVIIDELPRYPWLPQL